MLQNKAILFFCLFARWQVYRSINCFIAVIFSLILSHSMSAITYSCYYPHLHLNCPFCTLFYSLLSLVDVHCGLQKMDTTARAVLDIMTKTTEYLQPNPGDMNQLDKTIICACDVFRNIIITHRYTKSPMRTCTFSFMSILVHTC